MNTSLLNSGGGSVIWYKFTDFTADFYEQRKNEGPPAKWLLSMAGRYSGGQGNTAARADDILRAEIGKKPGLTD